MNRNRKELGKFILKKKIYILLIMLIFIVTGISYSMTNVKYIVSQKILVGNENSELIDTYKEIMKGSTTLEKVIQNLNLNMSTQELANSIEVSTIENTNMIEIKAFGEKEEVVQNIPEEISKVFTETVNGIYGEVNFYQVDHEANYETTGNTVLIGFCAGIAGLLLASLFFAIAWLLDTKIKSCKDIEEITGLKSLISIPNIKLIAKKKLNIRNIRAHKSEVFKMLMTNIQFVNSNHLQSKSILVTSPNTLVGKTYVATNLAIEFARAGKKVILIDGDMRRGRIAKIFNLPNELGFSNYLSNLDSNGNHINERINRFINDTEIKNLNVITSGNVPPNPTELLQTSRVDELIKDLKIFYDIVLFDTVSLLDMPEAMQLSKRCDLSLILSAYGKTKKEDLNLAYEQISNHNGNCIGMGFNKIPETKLRRKMGSFRNNTKRRIYKLSKMLKAFSKKVGKFVKKAMRQLKRLNKLKNGLKNIFTKFSAKLLAGLAVLKKVILEGIHHLKTKSQDVKEYIQKHKNKKERIRLIESGSIPEDERNNIIKEVFEEKIAELEGDEKEYRKKLDTLKANIETKNDEELPKVRPVTAKIENQPKSKFDLIREQQKKEQQETLQKQTEETEIIPDEIEKDEPEIEDKSKIDAPSDQKLIQEEMQETKQELKQEKEVEQETFEPIDLSKQVQITEEMIRKQVEMDEMVRLAEKEEEEEASRMKRMKKEEKIAKRKERKEKIKNFFDFAREEKNIALEEERIRKMEAKIEEKIKRENEKIENRTRMEKEREEKRVYREMERERHRQELRIQEELQEDNLYPRPRI